MIPVIHRHRGGAAESDSPPIPGVVLKKGPWSAAEDKILTEYVRERGEGNWNAVQRNTALQRCGKSCRLRWANHLRPNLKKGAFSSEEERLIIDLHSKLGNKWARISAQLPGRTDNEVKNYWNTRVKRRLRHGLPLYPHDRPSPPQQPLSPPPAPPLPVSFLDPTSLPFPPPFFSFNNPPGFLVQSSFSNLGFNPPQQTQTHVELYPPTPPQLDFDYKLELPSNEFCPNFVADDQDDVDDGPKFYPNVTETSNNNSGLLDALLQESHSRAASATAANDFNKQDCVDVDQWDYIYANSSTDEDGEKMEEQNEEYTGYYRNEDLSSIVNMIPSVGKAAKEKNVEEYSNGQSSNVSEENAKVDIPWNGEEWFSPGNSYTSWDNLPRIC